MTDYSTLQADIVEWSARSDTAAMAPSFIRLAESFINRRVRFLEQETDVTLSFTTAAYEDDLPAGFLGFRSLIFPDAHEPECEYLPPAQFEQQKRSTRDGFSSILAQGALVYTIVSGKVRVLGPVGAAEPLEVLGVYHKRFTPLSDLAPTHYGLTNHYDLYLFAALVELWDWADEERQVAKYRARVNGVVPDIEKEEHGKRQGPAPLRRRPPDRGVV